VQDYSLLAWYLGYKTKQKQTNKQKTARAIQTLLERLGIKQKSVV
jgi:alcohol dehydrogenase class IV